MVNYGYLYYFSFFDFSKSAKSISINDGLSKKNLRSDFTIGEPIA